MRPYRKDKSDSLVFLFVMIMIGMLLTSIAQAESYLFGQQEKWVVSVSSGAPSINDFQTNTLSAYNRAWLPLPGSGGMKTTFNDGMAHFLFENSPEHGAARILPVNTRLILSLGLEETYDELTGYRIDSLYWYERYQPTLYFTVGHRW